MTCTRHGRAFLWKHSLLSLVCGIFPTLSVSLSLSSLLLSLFLKTFLHFLGAFFLYASQVLFILMFSSETQSSGQYSVVMGFAMAISVGNLTRYMEYNKVCKNDHFCALFYFLWVRNFICLSSFGDILSATSLATSSLSLRSSSLMSSLVTWTSVSTPLCLPQLTKLALTCSAWY